VDAPLTMAGRPTHEYGVVLIIPRSAVGKYLELPGLAGAGAASEGRADLQPRAAHLLARAASGQRGDPGAAIDIPAETLRPGDVGEWVTLQSADRRAHHLAAVDLAVGV